MLDCILRGLLPSLSESFDNKHNEQGIDGVVNMQSKKKPIVITLLSLFLLAALVVAATNRCSFTGGLSFPGFTEKSAIRANWGVQVPNEFKEEYTKSTASFHGDGGRYTVYQASKQSDFTSDFSSTRSKEIEDFVCEMGISLEVPPEYQPDLGTNYTWIKLEKNDTNTLVMLYIPENMRLFVVQFFS